MTGLKAAYINEIYKLSKKKKLIVAGILSAALTVVLGAIFIGINNLAGVELMLRGKFAIMILPFFEYTLIPLFTAFVAIDMFSGEFSNDTIKLTLTRPVSRPMVYLSKVLAAASFIGGFLIFTMLVSTAVSVFGGFNTANLFKTLLAYTASFFPLMVFALMVMLVANFAKGSASAFLISVVIFLAFKGLEFCFPVYKSFFFTTGFDWYRLFIGAYLNWGKIFRMLLIFVGYAAAFFGLGYYLFDERSV